MTQPALGILTVHIPGNPPFPERSFFRKIIQAGRKEGIQVTVFHPNAMDVAAWKVKGFQLNPAGKWTSVTVSVPKYIYDRCFYSGRQYLLRYKPYISKLVENKKIQFLGMGLKGKWQVHQIVSKHPVLSQFLPPTEKLENLNQIRSWLKQHESIIVKPASGSLGVGVMRISPEQRKGFLIDGRDNRNVSFNKTIPSSSELAHFFTPVLQKSKHLIQPYLTLRTDKGIPFDVRILVQKNAAGQWSTTGKAIRMGRTGSLTSNLHGGGKAFPFDKFVEKHFQDSEIQKINEALALLEQELPPHLEKHHGPLVELGIDIGIDSDKNVWLIEVNSKPGRQIFEQIQDDDAFLKSQVNPLYYAKYLMQSHIGG